MPQTLILDHVSPATRLLEKRRQMFEVQEALDAQKEEFARREEAFRRREEGLRKKDLELQESLIKFNKFLQENESKRNRAIKRAADERKQRELKEQEIKRLNLLLTSYNEESNKLNELVKKNMKYTHYLEMVQESVPEDYPEISDLVNRYNTLKDANMDLTQSQAAHEGENDDKRANFGTYSKERTNDILNNNNEIASLQKKLEVVESDVVKNQHDLDINVRNVSDKTLVLGEILMAVGNLLQRSTSGIHGAILKHTETKNSTEANTSSEPDSVNNGIKAMSDLSVIASYMMDFTSIVENRIEAQRMQKKMNAIAKENKT